MRNSAVLNMVESGEHVAPGIAEDQAVQSHLVVRGLTKRFPGVSTPAALSAASIEIAPHERLVLLGPSGCGKTTLLRCVAGLEEPTEGEIRIEDRTMYCARRGVMVPPERRDLSMVFQFYALWPHLSVAQNVLFPLQQRGRRIANGAELVHEALALVGCDQLADRYPSQLSGGQQQRVSLARAIVGNNNLILFDEPLSNVDARVRDQLRMELVSLHRRLGFSAIYVTHDQVEAAAFADRIAVMRQGRIEQIGAPRDVYQKPVNAFVAGFLGVSNSVAGTVTGLSGEQAKVQSALGEMTVDNVEAGLSVGDAAKVMFRPEAVTFSDRKTGDRRTNGWKASIEAVLFLGTQSEYALAVEGLRIAARPGINELIESGTQTHFSVAPSALHAFKQEVASA